MSYFYSTYFKMLNVELTAYFVNFHFVGFTASFTPQKSFKILLL